MFAEDLLPADKEEAEELKPHHRAILRALAYGLSVDKVLELLLEHYEIEATPKVIRFYLTNRITKSHITRMRKQFEKDAAHLPIRDKHWRLMKLNDVATHTDDPKLILSAVAQARQEDKKGGDGDDKIMKELREMADD